MAKKPRRTMRPQATAPFEEATVAWMSVIPREDRTRGEQRTTTSDRTHTHARRQTFATYLSKGAPARAAPLQKMDGSPSTRTRRKRGCWGTHQSSGIDTTRDETAQSPAAACERRQRTPHTALDVPFEMEPPPLRYHSR